MVSNGSTGAMSVTVLQISAYYVQSKDKFLHHSCLYVYLKRRFYTMLVIKYLMANFCATVSGVKWVMISTLSALHKGKILHKSINSYA